MPVTLAQVSPVADVITEDLSSTYVQQLGVLNATGIVSYAVTSPIPQLLVFASGAIQSSGFLPLGSYTVSGTSQDTHGDSGTWTFTLTVIASAPAAPTSIVPVAPSALPTGLEITVPFHIDPATGGVAVTFDYVTILEQHIASIVMTAAGERVMLPTYGSGLENAVFSPIYDATRALLADDIKKQIKAWEPAVNVLSVLITPNQQQAISTLSITITFSVVPFTNVNTLTVSAGGTIQQVTSS